ncbi:class I adenylate-forming enzyme family protein [Homoserinimonas sp. A447]
MTYDMFSYQDLVRTLAGGNASRIAIEDDSVQYTYAQWHQRTSSLAAGLRDLGLRNGDSVMWLSPNTAEYVIAYHGTAKAGLRFSPLNFWLRDAELRAAISLVRPACLIVHPDHVDKVAAICDEFNVEHRLTVGTADVPVPAGWRPLEEIYREVDPDLDFGGRPDSPHEIIFTSGTTGQVKGVARTQQQRILEAVVSVMVQPQGRSAFVLRGAPQFHVGGGTGPLQTLIQGGRTRIIRFKPQVTASNIAAGVTHISGVPAQFQLLFESGALEGVDTSGVRSCGIGGNGASPAQFLRIQEHFPNAELIHFYGSTESGMVSSIGGAEFHERLNSVGRPAPGVDVRIVADDGTILQAGGVGELEVRSDFMMSEYFGRPDITAEALTPDGFLKMGDLSRIDDEGYMYIVGRKKDMIISGGENIYPKEIEDVVAALDFVSEVAIIGTPDAVMEERVVGVVRLADGCTDAGTEQTDAITAAVKEKLAGYKAPKEIHFVEDFPRNAMGKIDRVALRREYSVELA